MDTLISLSILIRNANQNTKLTFHTTMSKVGRGILHLGLTDVEKCNACMILYLINCNRQNCFVFFVCVFFTSLNEPIWPHCFVFPQACTKFWVSCPHGARSKSNQNDLHEDCCSPTLLAYGATVLPQKYTAVNPSVQNWTHQAALPLRQCTASTSH